MGKSRYGKKRIKRAYMKRRWSLAMPRDAGERHETFQSEAILRRKEAMKSREAKMVDILGLDLGGHGSEPRIAALQLMTQKLQEALGPAILEQHIVLEQDRLRKLTMLYDGAHSSYVFVEYFAQGIIRRSVAYQGRTKAMQRYKLKNILWVETKHSAPSLAPAT